MSCRALGPSATPTNFVSTEQHNSIVARFEAEVQTRTQLEAELASARNEVATLRRRLSVINPDTEGRPSLSLSAPQRPCGTPSNSVPEEQLSAKDECPQFSSRGGEDEPSLAARDSTSRGHDKEILSHCSDISGFKSGVRPSESSLKKSSHRKSSTNLAAMGGVTKKGKSKKERVAKAKIPGQSRYWTPEEHKLFLEALNKYGHKDLRSISNHVCTRNMTQVRTHSQKYFMRLMREAKRQNPVGTKTESVSGDERVHGDESAANQSGSAPAASSAGPSTSGHAGESCSKGERDGRPLQAIKDADNGDKYSVPNTCGMTLLCLVGQDTLDI